MEKQRNQKLESLKNSLKECVEELNRLREDINKVTEFTLHRTSRNRDMIYRLYELLGIERLVPDDEHIGLTKQQEEELQRLLVNNPIKSLLKEGHNERS